MIEVGSKQREAGRSSVAPKKGSGHALIADALRHCGIERVVGITGSLVDQISGGHAEFVTDATVLGDALDRAAASGLPACVNVRVGPYAPHPGVW